VIFSKPVRRTRGGRFAVSLSPDERTVLRRLPADLKAMLAEPDDPSLRRLFPAAYQDDADKEQEFRRLMQPPRSTSSPRPPRPASCRRRRRWRG